MWLKVLLLLLCLLVLFLISRIVESTLFLETGFLSTSLIDPVSLGVRELKRILRSRGVSYVGVLEKQELTTLVLSSGQLSEGELVESSASNGVDGLDKDQLYSSSSSSGSSSSGTYFTCGSHFYEEVEDTKDSVWLLQVQPTHADLPLLDDYNWKQVRTRLKPFGIRTGVFNCQLDPKLCKKKGWFDRQLVLALPQGVHPKDNVVYESFRSSTKWGSAVHWVGDRLNSRLRMVQSADELENGWLRSDDRLGTDVRMLLILPRNVEPPLFYSALSTKFSGRVTFGVIDPVNAETLLGRLPQRLTNTSSGAIYVVITPEGVFEYGTRVGEHLNFKRMELMLRTLQPEMNDVFVWSLTAVNLLILFDICLVYDKLWKHGVRCFWTLVKHNSFLFLLWLAILGLSRFQFVDVVVSNLLLKVARSVATVEVASVLRNDFMFWRCNPWFLIAVFVSMCVAHSWLRKRWFPSTVPSGNDSGDFVTVLTNLFFPPTVTLRRPIVLDGDMAMEMDRLVERLAMPNLWLQPVFSRLDYVDDLPVWRHRCAVPAASSTAPKTEEEQLSEESSCSCSSSSYLTASEGEEPANRRNQSSQSNNNHNHQLRGATGSNFECCVHSYTHQQFYHGLLRGVKKLAAKSKRLLKVFRSKSPSAGTMKRPSKYPPVGMVLCCECAICLESYRNNELICGLPCGHNYHQKCILSWIVRDHHQCPSCRWPTYGRKRRGFFEIDSNVQ